MAAISFPIVLAPNDWTQAKTSGGCPRCASLAAGGSQLGDCLCSHAEENAITQAAYHGVSLRDATIFTTFAPCLICSKMIINAGIREVVYHQEYPLTEVALQLLTEARVKVRQYQPGRPPS